MNLLLLKDDVILFYAHQKLQARFIEEGIKAWDRLEGVLPYYGDFLSSYVQARWKSFFKNVGNN